MSSFLFIEQEILSVLKSGSKTSLEELVLRVVDNLEIYGMEERVENMIINMIVLGKIEKDADGSIYFR
ncbi:MAG: hypothetical protein KatS3mg101_0624 [Patescibacteria group bacterium]|nr:MAG: hypothetical protein KatS3mg101_0624 [Patescibacteria group bacterium]